MTHRVLLPDDVLPTAYDLSLEPDFERFTFDGQVCITVDVKIATDTVSMHAKDLLVHKAFFTAADSSNQINASVIAVNKKSMTVILTFDDILPVGTGTISVTFVGELNNQMAGFYRSEYTDLQGNKKMMATTQFEAIDARRCFPCWDEPARKATFTVSMTCPKHFVTLSNMPESRVTSLTGGTKKKYEFLPTPIMSTYLLAFCVGEFEFIQEQMDETMIRVLCCPGKVAQCDFALKCAGKALKYYNDFFGIPFPLPKMDMIAIPDFAAGAMENWGLVTYREVALLCDEKSVSAAQKNRICTVITHELAHQWFGNLVTMAWWDDLWLNEGFANWMQTFCADALFPEWKIWESYVGAEQQQALSLDALRSSHPIQVPIKEAEEVEEVFDAISYCKGGAVVRMIYAILGKDKFREGLQVYFKRHQYSNTETTDLWKAWEEVSGEPITAMMGTWTSKMGYPVLQVEEGAGGKCKIKQSWFLADGSVEPDDGKSTWVVPILVGPNGGALTLLKEKEGTISFPDGCLKLNWGQHVPVRVSYPPSMLDQIVKNFMSLPAEDRIGMLSDTYALVKAGHAQPEALAKLLSGLSSDRNDKSWAQASACFGGLEKVLKSGGFGAGLENAFAAFASRIHEPCSREVGWETQDGDDDNRKKLRQLMISSLANFSATNPDVWAAAKPKYDAFVANPATSAVSADIRNAVLRIAAKNVNGETIFAALQEAHGKIDDGAVKRDIYSALGNIPDLTLKRRFLDWSLTPDIRTQDLPWPIIEVATSGLDGGEIVFKWLEDKYDDLYARMGTTSQIIFQHIVRASGIGFARKEDAEKVKAFWNSKSVASMVAKTLQQVYESICSNEMFKQRLEKSQLINEAYWQGLCQAAKL